MLRRNPRRAYEKNGSEIPPMTLANMRENGTHSIAASCTECQHAATLKVDHLDGALPVPVCILEPIPRVSRDR
jgi:hypothetical protein